MRSLAAAFAAVALVACAAPAAAQAPARPAPQPAAGAPQPLRTIRVSGEGRVTVKPDVARVSTGVQVTGKDAKATVADANARMKTVLAELAKLGVAEKDVQTSQLQLAADRPWVNGRQGPVQGYTATNLVRVTVRNLEHLPTILGRLTAVGANAVEGVHFEREDRAGAQREALGRAVADARAQAEAIARAAGVELGEVVAVEEGGAGRPMPMVAMAMRGKAEEGAAVEPGELEIAATVQVVYGIR